MAVKIESADRKWALHPDGNWYTYAQMLGTQEMPRLFQSEAEARQVLAEEGLTLEQINSLRFVQINEPNSVPQFCLNPLEGDYSGLETRQVKQRLYNALTAIGLDSNIAMVAATELAACNKNPERQLTESKLRIVNYIERYLEIFLEIANKYTSLQIDDKTLLRAAIALTRYNLDQTKLPNEAETQAINICMAAEQGAAEQVIGQEFYAPTY